MIAFDYSLKTHKFKDLEDGDFFLIKDGFQEVETLYIKHHQVKMVHILFDERQDSPKFNCYNLSSNRFDKIDLDTDVVKCIVSITAKPER